MLQTKPLDKCRPDISPPTHKLKGFATSPIARPHCGGSEQTSAADEQKKDGPSAERGFKRSVPPKAWSEDLDSSQDANLGPNSGV